MPFWGLLISPEKGLQHGYHELIKGTVPQSGGMAVVGQAEGVAVQWLAKFRRPRKCVAGRTLRRYVVLF